MPVNEQYLGYETVPTEGYMQPDRYKLRLKCLRCGHEYQRIVRSLNDPDPPCPRKACKLATEAETAARAERNRSEIFEAGQFPGITGDKPMVKAIDATASQVMQDYGLTDLKDNIRPGETMAPKLPGKMQEAADNFFGGGAKANSQLAKRMNRFGQRALAGQYASAAVAPSQVFPGKPGETALRHVGTEKF